MKGIDGSEIVRGGFNHWLNIVETYLDRHLSGQITEKSPNSLLYKFKFGIAHQSNKIDVDLLVSPYWDKPEDLYRFLLQIPKNKRSMLV